MDEHYFRTLKELSINEKMSQRDLAQKLDISLGKVNYLLKALIDKGYIKAKRFKNSNNKRAYMYVLTPSGIRKRVELTYAFLKRKISEYERLEKEIEDLRSTLDDLKV